jgi:ERCC4-type nuclease
MKEVKVIVDQRERNPEIADAFSALGIEADVRTIPVGDYIASERVGIERKTVSDFESSIINGRLFDQIERLKQNYEFPILILEGDRDNFRLKSNVINGTIVAIFIDYGVAVICSDSPTHTAELIASIAKREQNGKARTPSAKGGMRAYTHEQFQEYIIGNLPGVGEKLAKALLKHFKSVRNIANADTKELTKVEKIGKKKAEKIHDTLNNMYNSAD